MIFFGVGLGGGGWILKEIKFFVANSVEAICNNAAIDLTLPSKQTAPYHDTCIHVLPHRVLDRHLGTLR